MNPLESATTHELLAELTGRFDHAVFAGIFPVSGEDDKEGWLLKWKGGPTACYGVAGRAVKGLAGVLRLAQSINPEDDP